MDSYGTQRCHGGHDDQHRRRLRQRLRRIVIPVACVIMMLGAILAIATSSYQQNRRDALALSDDLLRELQRPLRRR